MSDNAYEAGGYAELAGYYDRLYWWKDYRAESERVRDVLRREGVADGGRVLDAACGTGAHLVHLREWFDVAGFDGSLSMLAVAMDKLPGVRLWDAELTEFSVREPFDAVVCLFSSIGYLLDEASLRASAARFAAAVRPGGVVLVEPWFTPEAWHDGRPSVQTYDSEDLKLVRATVAQTHRGVSVMDMHWLVVERGQPVRHYVDHHELWLCPHEVLVSAFQDAGFDARFEPDGLMDGRGLLIGRRT